MKLFFVALVLAIARAGVINTKPKCVTIRGTTYEQEILKNNIPSPYQLALDYDTNTLFFSYTAKTSETFKIAYLSLKTYEYGLVSGINGGFANAVDGKGHKIYMGGEDGLYEFDFNTKSATKLNVNSNENIWQMFYKDGLYFTTYPDEKAFLYKNGKVVAAPGLVDKVMVMAVKNDGNYIYSNSSGLFTYNKISKKATYIDDYVVNGFTADINGNIYFSTPTGIYSVNDKTNEIEKLATFESVYGLAIEGNGNIIYANENNIIRLQPTNLECLEDLTVKSLEEN